MEGVDRPAGAGVGNSKRSGSPKYNECAKAPRPTMVRDPKSGSPPLLLLSPEEGGCRVYNPDEDKVYETKSDFSGYRFLANSGKWFLVLDESRSDLYIVDVFSEERINLPPLESIKGGINKVERVGDNEFTVDLIKPYMPAASCPITTKYLRGLLWVDDKKKKNGVDYVVVWKFQEGQFLGFCRKGDFHYRDIPIRDRVHVPREYRGLQDVVLKGHRLYYLSHRCYIRELDLSGQGGFKDVYSLPSFEMWKPSRRPSDDLGITGVKKLISSRDSIAVTTSGDVLLVYTKAYEPVCESSRIFRVFKSDPKDRNSTLVEVESLGDEALFFDLGITVPADPTLGIEPNSIYFTRNDRFGHPSCYIPCLDICVYNIATRTIKRFLSGSTLKLKDAQWFLPSA